MNALQTLKDKRPSPRCNTIDIVSFCGLLTWAIWDLVGQVFDGEQDGGVRVADLWLRQRIDEAVGFTCPIPSKLDWLAHDGLVLWSVTVLNVIAWLWLSAVSSARTHVSHTDTAIAASVWTLLAVAVGGTICGFHSASDAMIACLLPGLASALVRKLMRSNRCGRGCLPNCQHREERP